eukprot:TRINITY_DN924_c0_g1_i1.p1 TRINITY_DN924_c0_g1~~TRINITY_DN924_c0_g1_i1.p1  ORF type:complete len:186 (+),score=48.66 TRINITY_DN924_c0_g1_i1:27-560(+)
MLRQILRTPARVYATRSIISSASQRCFSTAAPATSSDAPTTPHVAAIADQITKLNILEVVELSKLLQDKFGMPAGMPMMGMAAAAPAAAPAAAAAPVAEEPKKVEQTEFTVKLMKVADGAKYKIIKELREIKPSLSLMETKNLVEKLPSNLAEKVSKEEADKIINKIKEAGGDCEML